MGASTLGSGGGSYDAGDSVLIAALGGAFIGAMVSGGLLILSHHLQAKRDDQRQQRALERAARVESLDWVKRAIDVGSTASVFFGRASDGGGIDATDEEWAEMRGYEVTLNRALVSAIAIGAAGLQHELVALSANHSKIVDEIRTGRLDMTRLDETIENLARLESLYIELKSGS